MHFRPLFCLILGCFFTLTANAEIKLQQINGFSRQVGFVSNGPNTSLTIYGGFVGSDTVGPPGTANSCATKDNLTPCNNCRDNGSSAPIDFDPCNLTRAYPELRLQLTFSSTSIQTGVQSTPKIETISDGTTSVALSTASVLPATVSGPNQNVTLQITWRTICEGLNDATADKSTCKIANKSQAFRIGFDGAGDGLTVGTGDDSTTFTIVVHGPPDTDVDDDFTLPSTCTGGICDFWLQPGDEKATVKNAVIKPLSNSRPVAFAIFYCQVGDHDQIIQTDLSASLPVTNNIITESKITGLANGTKFSCHAAIQDDVGNIGPFFKGANAECPAGSPTECRSVTPDEVLGLFSDNPSCVIATAAYGSPMEKHVVLLKQFRDKVLMKSLWGRLAVRFYYTASPPVARWIAQDPARRQITRFVLSPVIFTTSFLMTWSWALGAVLLFGCGFIAFRRKLS